MRRVALIGTGLIGTSIGMALRSFGHHVTGWDPVADESATAFQQGGIDAVASNRDTALAGVDLVVLAAPPDAILVHLSDLETDSLVMDVAGVKGPVVEAAVRLPRFVGTHPMAGREHGGARHASSTLFRGAMWIITSDGASTGDIREVERLVDHIGAVPIVMTAEQHDDAVAAISHIPQSIAVALVQHAAVDPSRLQLASGSFRDLTRVALSSERMWTEILDANGAAVSRQLRQLASRIESFAGSIESGDREAIESQLAEARLQRQGMAPPVVAVALVLEDRPGELARVGEALAGSHVDVRDLQLRHGRHGGGGVLTISVRPGEAEPLRAALLTQGFELA